MIVPMTMLSWVTPPAMTPGMPSLTRRRTPSVMRGHLSFGATWLRRTPSASSQSCSSPAANTPQACTTPASGSLRNPRARATKVAAIIVTFNTIETAELSTNLPSALSTPDSKATSDMHNR